MLEWTAAGKHLASITPGTNFREGTVIRIVSDQHGSGGEAVGAKRIASFQLRMFSMASRAIDRPLSFIDEFQSEIDRLGCLAVVRIASRGMPADTIELFDDDGTFVSLLPASVTPETAVLAFGLYQLGLRSGRRAGEDNAWAKLRQMIGAPSIADSR